MSYPLLNTLYVMTPGSYLHLDNDTVRIEVERETKLRVPLHHLAAIVTTGDVLISPALIGRCAESAICMTLLDRNGRFRARIEGPISGNVLLRKAQFDASADRRRSVPRRGGVVVRFCNAAHGRPRLMATASSWRQPSQSSTHPCAPRV